MTVRKSLVVYCAGGTRSGWAQKVKEAVPGPIYLDPAQHGLKEENDYTDWDLTAVDMADVLICYLEKDNPSGAGLAVEVGYAAAKGKTIIYVEEPGFQFSRYFGMVRRCATYVGNELFGVDGGIAELKMLVAEKRPALKDL
jgi:nucleoside 2-deoxyribosyltransferase